MKSFLNRRKRIYLFIIILLLGLTIYNFVINSEAIIRYCGALRTQRLSRSSEVESHYSSSLDDLIRYANDNLQDNIVLSMAKIDETNIEIYKFELLGLNSLDDVNSVIELFEDYYNMTEIDYSSTDIEITMFCDPNSETPCAVARSCSHERNNWIGSLEVDMSIVPSNISTRTVLSGVSIVSIDNGHELSEQQLSALRIVYPNADIMNE